MNDPINQEILRIKHELAAKFDNDISRIAADARNRQKNAVSRSAQMYQSKIPDASHLPAANFIAGESSAPVRNVTATLGQ